MELAGKIKLIMETQTFDSGFSKREFVVTTQEQYPQDVKFECVKDRISLLEGLSPGDGVKVEFNIRGNEYNGRYFVNLQAWRITKAEQENPGEDQPLPPSDHLIPDSDEEEDDLPF